MAIPALRTEIKRFVILGFWIFFAIGYFGRFELPGFLSEFPLIIIAILACLSAFGYGTLFARRLSGESITPGERFLFSYAIGLGLLMLLIVLFGVFGWWTKQGVALILAIGLILFWMRVIIPAKAGIDPFSRQSWIPASAGMTIPVFLIFLGGLASFLIAFTPITYYDSLVYHLALPQAYLQAKHWISQVDLIYSAFPQNMEMLWLYGKLLGGDIVVNLLGWSIAIAGMGGVYLFGKRYFNEKTAVWSAALLSLMPAYLLLSSGGYVDMGLTFFSFMSLYAICLWKNFKHNSLLALAGFLAGCAMGIKYTGAIPFVIGAILIAASRPRLSGLFLYTGLALLLFSPWLIKNTIYVGNPVFPFFYSMSSKSLSPWVGQAAAGYFRGLTEYSPHSGLSLIKLVWDVAAHGFNFGRGMDVLGDLGWAPLIAFLPGLWFMKKGSTVRTFLWIYLVLFFIPWGMTRPVLRFLLPLAPILAILSAAGLDAILSSGSRYFIWATGLFLGLLILSNAYSFCDVADALSLYQVPMGFEDRNTYLSSKLDYFDAASFVNKLPEDTVALVVGDQRAYYYNRPTWITPVFNQNPLTEWANQAASPKELAAGLKRRGITDIVVNYSEMDRLDRAYHLFPFTKQGQSNWDNVRQRYAKSIYRDAHCEVFAL